MAVRAADALRAGGATEVVAVGGDLPGLGAVGLDARGDDHPGEGPLGGILTALRLAAHDARRRAGLRHAGHRRIGGPRRSSTPLDAAPAGRRGRRHRRRSDTAAHRRLPHPCPPRPGRAVRRGGASRPAGDRGARDRRGGRPGSRAVWPTSTGPRTCAATLTLRERLRDRRRRAARAPCGRRGRDRRARALTSTKRPTSRARRSSRSARSLSASTTSANPVRST